MKDLTLSPEQQAKFDEHARWAGNFGLMLAGRYQLDRDVCRNAALTGLAKAVKTEKPVKFKTVANLRILAEVIDLARDEGQFSRNVHKEEILRLKAGLLPTVVNGDKAAFCAMPDDRRTEIQDIEDKEEVQKFLSLLRGRELYVIEKYFFEDLSLREIGVHLDVSESRVCQIYHSAMQKMRRAA